MIHRSTTHYVNATWYRVTYEGPRKRYRVRHDQTGTNVGLLESSFRPHSSGQGIVTVWRPAHTATPVLNTLEEAIAALLALQP
jgi:hypothetical protein